MPLSGCTVQLDPRQVAFSLGARENFLPYYSDTYDLGSPNKLWRTAYLSELYSLLFSQNSIVLLGSRFVVGKGQGSLSGSVSATDTQIDFSKPMNPNDFVLFRVPLQVEAMKIGTLASGSTIYNVTRNLDGSGANDWPAGSVYLVLGNNGDGRIELDSESTPTMKMILQGTAWNSGSEVARIGNLNNNWGYTTDVYGAAFGQYSANKPNITVDSASGLRIRNYNSDVMKFDNSGCSLITGKLSMPETNSAIAIGVVPPSGSQSGNGIWIDRNGVYSVLSNASQVKLTSSGLYAGQGNVWLDANGLKLLAGIYKYNEIDWLYSSGSLFRIAVNTVGSLDSAVSLLADSSLRPDGFTDVYLGITSSSAASIKNYLKLSYKEVLDSGGAAFVFPEDNDYLSISGGILLFKNGNTRYSGSLISYKNSTEYPGYIHVPLETQLTTPYFEGNNFADVTSSCPINLYQRFGVPKGTKAVDLQIITLDSGSFGSQGLYFSVGPSAGEWYHLASRPLGGYVENEIRGWTSCSLVAGSPVIYCQINASSGSSLKAYMRVCGYAI